MVNQLAPAVQQLVEPNAPTWAQRMVLAMTRVFQPIRPIQPNFLWRVPTAELPPPADFPGSLVLDTTTGGLKVSNGSTWAAPAGGGSATFRGALVYRNTGLAGQNLSVAYAVPFTTALYDTDSLWSAGSPTRLTVPAGVTRIRLTGGIAITNGTTGEWFQVLPMKNGVADFPAIPLTFWPTLVATARGTFASGVIPVVAGDFFELRGQTQTDTSVDLVANACWLGMEILA